MLKVYANKESNILCAIYFKMIPSIFIYEGVLFYF